MYIRIKYFLAATLCSCFLIVNTQVGIAQSQSLRGRIVAQTIQEDMKVLEVGDLPGHTIMLVKAKGLAFLENGDIAEVNATEIIDDVNGKGAYQGYEILTFEDGSTIVSKFEGSNETIKNGKFVDFEGTFTYTDGTGRFEGIQGGGKHKGRNHMASGSGFYVNFEGTYTLSSN